MELAHLFMHCVCLTLKWADYSNAKIADGCGFQTGNATITHRLVIRAFKEGISALHIFA